MVKVYAGFGSNLGDREGNLVSAIARIEASGDVCVKARSGFYETRAVGGPPQPDYVNCVVELDTVVEPQKLLERFKAIERELGRRPSVRWGSRIIDIDILLYGDREVNDSNLKIPHELMHERRFVLEPLCEISPDLEHPVLKRKMRELLDELR